MKHNTNQNALMTKMMGVLIAISAFIFLVGAVQTHGSDNCKRRYPKPVIKYDHTDAEGRIYIPVVNSSAYPNEMFRQAPELPPCGTNTKSSRTWVDIYNADTNARIYGFCAFGSNTDLKSIWFKPTTPNEKVYIIMHDRACNKSYRSNTIAW